MRLFPLDDVTDRVLLLISCARAQVHCLYENESPLRRRSSSASSDEDEEEEEDDEQEEEAEEVDSTEEEDAGAAVKTLVVAPLPKGKSFGLVDPPLDGYQCTSSITYYYYLDYYFNYYLDYYFNYYLDYYLNYYDYYY